MGGLETLGKLKRSGLSLSLEGDKIRVKPVELLTEEIRSLILECMVAAANDPSMSCGQIRLLSGGGSWYTYPGCNLGRKMRHGHDDV